MPAPTNTSAATATDLGTLPAAVIQNVHDAGTTYTVWYKFTNAGSAAVMVGLFGFGGTVGSGYQPSTEVFIGPVGAPVSTGVFAQHKPVQFDVPAGETRYIKFTTSAGNPTPASLSIDALAAVEGGVVGGQRPLILINDDTENFPATILDVASAAVVGFIRDFPAGEAGDRLPTGETLVSDAWNGNLQLYDADLASATPVAFDIGFGTAIRANRPLNVFYAGNRASPAVVKVIAPDGTITTTITLTGNNSLAGMAASNDGSIIYHGRSTNQPIKRWDVVGNTNGTNLSAAEGANITAGQDIIVLEDGTILASIVNQVTGAFSVKRFNDGGTLLNTYTIAASSFLPASTPPRIASGELEDTFWAWFHLSGGDQGKSRFVEIEVATGSVLQTIDSVEYETGSYQPAETATPLARFGHSFSCFFAFIPGSPLVVDLSEECCACDCPVPVGPKGSPTSAPLPSHTGPILPPVDPLAYTPFCAGLGDVPTALDATDPESWAQ